jgi:hypothetical protein
MLLSIVKRFEFLDWVQGASYGRSRLIERRRPWLKVKSRLSARC